MIVSERFLNGMGWMGWRRPILLPTLITDSRYFY